MVLLIFLCNKWCELKKKSKQLYFFQEKKIIYLFLILNYHCCFALVAVTVRFVFAVLMITFSLFFFFLPQHRFLQIK